VRLDNGKNIGLLDKHLRYLINPYLDSPNFHKDSILLYKPLFEVIKLRIARKKKVNKEEDWVNRLYKNSKQVTKNRNEHLYTS